jgi:ABC-type transport system involved in cytochrome c biogenesis permease subunit
MTRLLPLFVVVPAAAYLLVGALPPEEPTGKMRLHEFGKLPVADHGRIKPIDTLARIDLMITSTRQEFTDKAGGQPHPAVQWLLNVWTYELARNDAAERDKVFRIEDDQILTMLGLEKRPGFYRYSLAELGGKISEIGRLASEAAQKDKKDQDVFNRNILKLAEQIRLVFALAKLEADTLCVIPPKTHDGEWRTFREAAAELQANGGEDSDPAFRSFAKLLFAYAASKPEEFNKELTTYRGILEQVVPNDLDKASFEVFFNDFEPFLHCTILYVVVFLLCCVSWVSSSESLRRAAFWLTLVTLLVHTFAICARMYIQGRPPVTNLYSTAIFIGWTAALGGVLIETVFRNGLGTALAAVAGALTMLVAHNLAGDGDTMIMMQAVLDTNFWLATHVTIVNMGYAATMLAGLVGTAYILLGVATPYLTRDWQRVLGQALYGVLCFATLFSFVGTVLGGIWADQSWGRFWGWDPKENGALLIVIWNALILHARWAGLVKLRGMAVLSVFGNIVTTWSWFGVNLLGVGLHAYGFINGATEWLIKYDVSQLVIMGAGLLPLRYWWSFSPPKKAVRPTRAQRPVASSLP